MAKIAASPYSRFGMRNSTHLRALRGEIVDRLLDRALHVFLVASKKWLRHTPMRRPLTGVPSACAIVGNRLILARRIGRDRSPASTCIMMRRVGHRARERTGVIERPAVRHDAVAAHAPEGGLEPHRAAGGRRHADRAAGVRTQRRRAQARGDRRARAAARSGRHARRGPRDCARAASRCPRRTRACASCRSGSRRPRAVAPRPPNRAAETRDPARCCPRWSACPA